MITQEQKEKLENLLFKPIFLKEEEGESRLVIIFNLEDTIFYSVNPNGIPSKTNNITLDLIDITRTIITNYPSIDSYVISDIDKLLLAIEDIGQNSQDLINELSILYSVINTHSANIIQQLQLLGKIGACVKRSLPDFKSDEGSLIIGGETGGLAHIVFATVQGDTAKLKKSEIEKIGSVIMGEILKNLDINTSDQDEVDKFIENLEYMIIDSLPNNLTAGNIRLNKEGILLEIEKYKNSEDSEENDDEDENDDDIDSVR